MPVTGRFRLRRESRRAFLRSWVRFVVRKDSADCKILAALLFVSANLSIDLWLNVLISDFFLHAHKLSTFHRASGVH